MAKEISSWKQKVPYRIVAPENFELKEIGTTFSSNPKNLVGRTIDISLKDLTEDRAKQYLKVILEVKDVQDNRALTKFKTFEANKGYLHSKVRKGMSKIDYVTRIKLSDGEVRIKVMAVTQRKANIKHKKEIGARIRQTLAGYNDTRLDDFIQATLFGKLGTEIYHNAKTVYPINRVEVEEVRVL